MILTSLLATYDRCWQSMNIYKPFEVGKEEILRRRRWISTYNTPKGVSLPAALIEDIQLSFFSRKTPTQEVDHASSYIFLSK